MITGFNSEKKLTKNKLNVSFKKSITFLMTLIENQKMVFYFVLEKTIPQTIQIDPSKN